VVVHKLGATVISWLCDNREVLFLSSKAVFDNKKAIRGGIPVVFPNFGPWDLGPQHGFARISMWELTSQNKGSDVCSAEFKLVNDSVSEAMWNHKFSLIYKVELSKATGLTTSLNITNTGNDEFDFTTLLHTYIRVNDINTTSVSNLTGLKYDDKLKGGSEFNENSQQVSVVGGSDRVYKQTPTSHEISDTTGSLKVEITKINLRDTVVWNPWIENAQKMSDFDDEGYKCMMCVEPGAVSERISLKPAESRQFSQTIKVLSKL